MRIWQYSGILLIATGIIHNLVGFIVGWEFIIAILADGVWNSIAVPLEAGAIGTRAELLWFLLLGFAWIMLGAKFHADIRDSQQPLANSWGWLILLQGIVVACVYPQTGAWLFIPQGLIILVANFRFSRASIKSSV